MRERGEEREEGEEGEKWEREKERKSEREEREEREKERKDRKEKEREIEREHKKFLRESKRDEFSALEKFVCSKLLVLVRSSKQQNIFHSKNPEINVALLYLQHFRLFLQQIRYSLGSNCF